MHYLDSLHHADLQTGYLASLLTGISGVAAHHSTPMSYPKTLPKQSSMQTMFGFAGPVRRPAPGNKIAAHNSKAGAARVVNADQLAAANAAALAATAGIFTGPRKAATGSANKTSGTQGQHSHLFYSFSSWPTM